MKLQSLMNVRPVADLGTQLIATPTSGSFRLTPDAIAKLGLGEGDYIKIVRDNANPDAPIFYMTAGSYSEENGADGSKISSNKGYSFSSANAWVELDGNVDFNTHFNVGDAVEFEGMKLFPLSFDKKVPKQVRKSSDSANTADSEVKAESKEDFGLDKASQNDSTEPWTTEPEVEDGDSFANL